MVGDLLIQPRLDGIEQSPIQNDGLLSFENFAFENFAFESDFADIEAIAQELRERTARKRYAADALTCLEFTELGNNERPDQ
jgi:hypothetical protein